MSNKTVVEKSESDLLKDTIAINKYRYEVYGQCPECGALKLMNWGTATPITSCAPACRFYIKPLPKPVVNNNE